MKKLSKIDESAWGDMMRRGAGETRRREDGVKVHTCIDVDIYLINVSDSYYEELIKEILDYNNSSVEHKVAILNTIDKAYSTEEMKNIRAFEAPYTYLIYDGEHGTDLIAEFWTYDEMKDFDLDDFEDRVPEEDYISICKGIATKLKEVGGDIEYLPRFKGSFIATKSNNISDYDSDYVLQLIDESDVYDWEIQYTDKYGEGSTATCLDDYKESMIDTFPELNDVVFITWSFNNYACNIGIPITATTVKNFKKYKEYTKNWFTVDEIDESAWGNMMRRGSGEKERREDIINSNVKDIKPVDLGLSVLWADKDLEINDEYEFTIDEIADYTPDGWRRPTQKEADELLHNTKKSVDQDLSPKTFKRIFKLSNNGVDLYFSCKNLKEKAEYWELDKGNMDKYWNTFVLEESGSFVAHSAYQIAKPDEKHRVRFVREK